MRAAIASSSPRATSASTSRSLARAGEIVVAETQAAEVADVVRQPQIVVDEVPGALLASLPVGIQHDRLLRGKYGGEHRGLAGEAVCSGGTRYGCAAPARARDERQHARPKCRQQPVGRRHRQPRPRLARPGIQPSSSTARIRPAASRTRPAAHGCSRGRAGTANRTGTPGQLACSPRPLDRASIYSVPPSRGRSGRVAASKYSISVRTSPPASGMKIAVYPRSSSSAAAAARAHPVRVVPQLTAPDPDFA